MQVAEIREGFASKESELQLHRSTLVQLSRIIGNPLKISNDVFEIVDDVDEFFAELKDTRVQIGKQENNQLPTSSQLLQTEQQHFTEASTENTTESQEIFDFFVEDMLDKWLSASTTHPQTEQQIYTELYAELEEFLAEQDSPLSTSHQSLQSMLQDSVIGKNLVHEEEHERISGLSTPTLIKNLKRSPVTPDFAEIAHKRLKPGVSPKSAAISFFFTPPSPVPTLRPVLETNENTNLRNYLYDTKT